MQQTQYTLADCYSAYIKLILFKVIKNYIIIYLKYKCLSNSVEHINDKIFILFTMYRTDGSLTIDHAMFRYGSYGTGINELVCNYVL